MLAAILKQQQQQEEEEQNEQNIPIPQNNIPIPSQNSQNNVQLSQNGNPGGGSGIMRRIRERRPAPGVTQDQTQEEQGRERERNNDDDDDDALRVTPPPPSQSQATRTLRNSALAVGQFCDRVADKEEGCQLFREKTDGWQLPSEMTKKDVRAALAKARPGNIVAVHRTYIDHTGDGHWYHECAKGAVSIASHTQQHYVITLQPPRLPGSNRDRKAVQFDPLDPPATCVIHNIYIAMQQVFGLPPIVQKTVPIDRTPAYAIYVGYSVSVNNRHATVAIIRRDGDMVQGTRHFWRPERDSRHPQPLLSDDETHVRYYPNGGTRTALAIVGAIAALQYVKQHPPPTGERVAIIAQQSASAALEIVHRRYSSSIKRAKKDSNNSGYGTDVGSLTAQLLDVHRDLQSQVFFMTTNYATVALGVAEKARTAPRMQQDNETNQELFADYIPARGEARQVQREQGTFNINNMPELPPADPYKIGHKIQSVGDFVNANCDYKTRNYAAQTFVVGYAQRTVTMLHDVVAHADRKGGTTTGDDAMLSLMLLPVTALPQGASNATIARRLEEGRGFNVKTRRERREEEEQRRREQQQQQDRIDDSDSDSSDSAARNVGADAAAAGPDPFAGEESEEGEEEEEEEDGDGGEDALNNAAFFDASRHSTQRR
ncbi:MAG: hypothetical protein M0P42_16910, partial [Gallionella sp.]|nr:hypothetical protein [Gallionella sp.]